MIYNHNNVYYPWIDTIKGIAVLMITIHHLGLAKHEYYQWFHTGQGVSLFLFCSAFVLSKKSRLLSLNRFSMLFRRIIGPMLCVTLFLFLLSCIFMKPHIVILNGLHYGGFGPGSYYPWMYLGFYLFIAIYQWIDKRCNNVFWSFLSLGTLSFVLEMGFNFISSHIDNSTASYIWRIIPLRYLMIIFAALRFNFFEKHLYMSLLVFIVCGAFAWFDIYVQSISPSYGWLGYHWFSTLFVVPFILAFKRIHSKLFKIIRKFSYEIFLIQMIVFYVINNFVIALYPTYEIPFRLIEFLLIILFSFVTIKIKTNKLYESPKNHC